MMCIQLMFVLKYQSRLSNLNYNSNHLLIFYFLLLYKFYIHSQAQSSRFNKISDNNYSQKLNINQYHYIKYICINQVLHMTYKRYDNYSTFQLYYHSINQFHIFYKYHFLPLVFLGIKYINHFLTHNLIVHCILNKHY